MVPNVDLILPWVDGNDPNWRSEKEKYDIGRNTSEVRYQSWDNLQYIFRGIEANMPWVHKVYFVTWGHLPKWLNTSYKRIQVIRHEDYIP